MKLFFIFLMSFALSAQEEPVTVFQKGEEGYYTFRIPAIIQASNGDILAFAEARLGKTGDTGEIHLAMKRSTDEGRTWSPMQIVWKDGANTCGNPAPVVDHKSGRIILVTTWNDGRDHEKDIRFRTSIDTRRVFCLFSDDNGKTWSPAEEITTSVKNPEWTWYATGPCHAIQLQKGKYKGRLVVPCNHGLLISTDKSDVRTVSHVIYSDDIGKTWQIGGNPKVGNESTIAELQNGDLLLNMRVDAYDIDKWKANAHSRYAAISHDAGESFEEYYFDHALTEPRCQGTIANYTKGGRLSNWLVFCNPSSKKRNNMWLKLSTDGGKSWRPVLQVQAGSAAYSDILVSKKGNVGILYENGEKSCYEKISFLSVSAKIVRKASKNPIINK